MDSQARAPTQPNSICFTDNSHTIAVHKPKPILMKNGTDPKDRVALQNASLQQIPYYDEFYRFCIINSLLAVELKQLQKQKAILHAKAAFLRNNYNNNHNSQTQQEAQDNSQTDGESKKRRIRRMASEIQRSFVCTVERCRKSYGSEGSLHQHLRLKHPSLLTASNLQGSQQLGQSQEFSDALSDAAVPSQK